MNRITTICLLLFAIFDQSLNGQVIHDVKLNANRILKDVYIPSYEVIFDGKFGVAFSAGFDLSNDEFNIFPIQNEESTSFSASKFIPEFGGRFYTNSKQQGKGFFIGPYISWEILLSRERELTDLLAVISFQTTSPQVINSGLLESNFGINFGNKWVVKKNWIIEIFPTFVYSSQPFEDSPNGFEFDVDLKIGYRL